MPLVLIDHSDPGLIATPSFKAKSYRREVSTVSGKLIQTKIPPLGLVKSAEEPKYLSRALQIVSDLSLSLALSNFMCELKLDLQNSAKAICSKDPLPASVL